MNHDLYKVSLASDPNCSCGQYVENAYHYLFECPLYIRQRDTLMTSIKRICRLSDTTVDLALVLEGSTDLSPSQNQDVFKLVQSFISETKRFV